LTGVVQYLKAPSDRGFRFAIKGRTKMKTLKKKWAEVALQRRTRIKATTALIKRGRGVLKRAPGGRPLTEDWAEHKKQEEALEERHVR
jgi:hypothetical protein